MQTWQDILSTALVGTDRKALQFPHEETGLGVLLTGLDASDREGSLLAAAGAAALWRQAASHVLHYDGPLPEPCQPDEITPCAPGARHHLVLMLGGEQTALLPEWLVAAVRANVRVPEELLPELLDLGRGNSSLRPLIRSVIGKRGAWLAAQNPVWYYIASRDEATTWETGGNAERIALLEQLRRSDPDRARELVISTWKGEAAIDRASFISALETGLTMDDEPFLESGLDDRSKEVRAAAAEVLSHLPESRFVQRMVSRAGSILEFRPGKLLKKDAIEVRFPEGSDEAMARDGMELGGKKGKGAAGEKGIWLARLLGFIPPSTWSSLWKETPQAILDAAARSDWHKTLVEGWVSAAARYRDADWAEALLPITPDLGLQVDRLIVVVPLLRLEAYILRLLDSGDPLFIYTSLAARVMQNHRHPWSRRLTFALLDRARRLIDSHPPDDPSSFVQPGVQSASQAQQQEAMERYMQAMQCRNLLSHAARHVIPEILSEAESRWPQPPDARSEWNATTNESLQLLAFRREMLEALKGKE